jgi:methylated-DNA-[protein]-cysteine S-methyltransferase
MSQTRPTCREIEPDLVVVAAGEAGPATAQAVAEHVARCAPCRDELRQYEAVEGLVADLRQAPLPGVDSTLARAELQTRLSDLRRRLVTFGIFSSPIGPILIARTEQGVSMVEYLESPAAASSRLARLAGGNAVENEGEIVALFGDLIAYLGGQRRRLDWPLDLRWARGDFQRRVLQATAELPYGAVTSYAHIARDIGAPTATRAVAQALRWNPIPIVIPCHRVIGSSGDLTGYAGNKVSLKQRLLAIEGVRTISAREAMRVERRAMYVRYLAETEYCVPTCGELPSTPLSKLTLFSSREGAEAAGLLPCTSCRPDLHPI